jgi:hypothetical protein
MPSLNQFASKSGVGRTKSVIEFINLRQVSLRGARQHMKAKTGRCEGAKPYGKLPGKIKVIERMKALRSAG